MERSELANKVQALEERLAKLEKNSSRLTMFLTARERSL
jgi:hypothetical protein